MVASILTEPTSAGDIKSLLEERQRPTLCHYFFDFKEDSESAGLVLGNAKYILLGVLNGLKHLHSLGIMHRDIKCEWRERGGERWGAWESVRGCGISSQQWEKETLT